MQQSSKLKNSLDKVVHVIPDTDPNELASENESSGYDEDEDATDQDKHTISPKQDQKPKDALDGKEAQLVQYCTGNFYDSVSSMRKFKDIFLDICFAQNHIWYDFELTEDFYFKGESACLKDDIRCDETEDGTESSTHMRRKRHAPSIEDLVIGKLETKNSSKPEGFFLLFDVF